MKKVLFSQHALKYSKEELVTILELLVGITNSDKIAQVSEIADTHKGKIISNNREIKRLTFARDLKPFMFISCLN
jgi:hypothetical protein